MKKVSVILFLLVSFNSFSNIDKSDYAKKITIEQWQVHDFLFKATPNVRNPFIKNFEATFKSESGEQITVPGFYNGGNEWIVRFSTSKIGKWQFVTQSALKSLRNKKGSFSVIPTKNNSEHGGIIVKPENPQYFYYEDGTPYMQMAYECDWLFALDFENKKAAPKTASLLDDLQKNNLNQIVTTVYSFGAKWKRDPKLDDYPEYDYSNDLSIFPFLGTNKMPDFRLLNVAYFQQMDRTIAMMKERNISLHLMIYVWNKLVNWPDAETEADNMFFDYIIKRYQAFPNVVWDVAKEAYDRKRCSTAYILERLERIKKLDAYKRLKTVHEYDFCIKHPDKVDIISAQNWSATIYHDMLGVKKAFPNKPIFNIEHGGYTKSEFEVFPGDYVDPEISLRRNYMINFSGTYSTYYWQGTSWYVMIHDIENQPKGFVKPKYEYYKNFVNFFKKYPFNEFTPDLKSNNSGYTLTNNKGVFLMYLPKYNYQASIFYLSPFFSKTGTYQWFNTLTGEYSEVFQFKKGNFMNPWYNKADAILIRTH
ncbi:DUF5060 domain-containing protein [Polaribacter sp. Z014]|uniref:DUF5060 domain-containing protein n=1 Tax=Polaribacter sp. Z014 TaxID=2927126 RepID=UPI0020200AF0|nr:DUF5060 domain-containing protein [Polaribacter sp. Z014]MCL7762533.1 DUF5060 domain-containing protein [Polaribacter sp. Z014]